MIDKNKSELDDMLLDAALKFLHVTESPDFSLSRPAQLALAEKKRKIIIYLKNILDNADHALFRLPEYYGLDVKEIEDFNGKFLLNATNMNIICIGYASRLLVEDSSIEEKACSLYNMELMLSKHKTLESFIESHPVEGAWVKKFVALYTKLTECQASIERQAGQQGDKNA